MSVIRIWALESDYDRDVAGKLARKWLAFQNIQSIDIRTSGRKAYTTVVKKQREKGLEIAIESYLQNNEDKIIFLLDSDSPISLAQRRSEPNSLISRVEKILKSGKFTNKVFLAFAVQELEAWLLVDCLGVFCFFARQQHDKEKCRNSAVKTKRYKSLINKYQKGNTETLLEAVSGGKGAKEYLVKYSEEILKILNPKLKHRNVYARKYREGMSPELADYIEINKTAFLRNPSLQKFFELITN